MNLRDHYDRMPTVAKDELFVLLHGVLQRQYNPFPYAHEERLKLITKLFADYGGVEIEVYT